MFFLFKQKTAYEMRISDWSSDVCSSDLGDAPAIWRGPMVTQAFEQMLRQTNWRDLDYLIIDMPPGTGDLALTLAQKVPVVGAVIVTTPQDLALQDARKGLRMFQKVDVPILGIVENMAVHICTQCGHAEHIFGEGGGRRMAEQYQAPWLGSLPLAMAIRARSEEHTSELQSLMRISYAVFCLKKQK